MPFQIQVINREIPIHGNPYFLSESTGIPHKYETGAQAAAIVIERKNMLALDSPVTYRIVKIEVPDGEPNEFWKERERERLESGYYDPAPWSEEYWYRSSDYSRIHFLHMSRDKEAFVAYTESHDKGVEDKQMRIRAGKYLQKYFHDILDSDEIKFWAGKVSILTGETQEFQLATTPDEIERIYVNGPNSCMGHHVDRYESPFHPTRVYGAGDLAVAYIERDNSIAARCLCWPEKKIYARIYGDGGVWSKQLGDLLESASYTRAYDSSCWTGARLIRHEYNDGFVAPYFDIPVSLTDDGEYLKTVMNGEIDPYAESGVTGDVGRICDNCYERYNDEDEGGMIGGSSYCDSCYCELSFHCEDCSETGFAEDSHYIESSDRCVCESCADDYPSCDDCGERNSQDSSYHIESSDKTVCESCYEEKYFSCEECGESESQKNRVERIDGESICASCAESMVECIECHKHDESDDCFVDSDGDSWCSDCRQSCLEFTAKESI